MEASARASGGVFRDRREVRPPACSAKVRARQPGFTQKSRRIRNRIRTRRPPIAASDNRRW